MEENIKKPKDLKKARVYLNWLIEELEIEV